MSQTVYILVGLPGSGKSTLCEKRFPMLPCVSSDAIIEEWAKIANTTYNEIWKVAVKEAHQLMYKEVDMLIANKVSFVWDQTNLSKAKRAEIIAKIPEDYEIYIAWLDVPVELCKMRNAKRDRSIPENVIDDMAKRFEVPALDEKVQRIWRFDENSDLIGEYILRHNERK